MTGPAMPTEGERWSRLAARMLAPNPGPMTLDGTNSFVLREPGSASVVVVDPGPHIPGHLARLAAAGTVELILLTHRHADHSEAAAPFAAMTGAPVRAKDPDLCRLAPPLADDEVLTAAGVRIRVLATPGHTADSVSFVLPDDRRANGVGDDGGSVLTGDTILGRGTTVIAPPDGTLADYLDSLAALRTLGAALVLPAHGPALPDLAAVCEGYLAHRRDRLRDVTAALTALGVPASTDADTVARVTDAVYPDVDPAIRFAAEASTRAQLHYLTD